MIATSAKLAELLEAASPGSWSVLDVWTTGGDIMVHADRKSVAVVAEENARPNAELIAAVPDLARLVLTLSEALESAQSLPLLMKDWDKSSRNAAYDNIRAALAAVEELEKEL